jgi:hypothetical protein
MEHQRKQWIGKKQHDDFGRFKKVRLQTKEAIELAEKAAKDGDHN